MPSTPLYMPFRLVFHVTRPHPRWRRFHASILVSDRRLCPSFVSSSSGYVMPTPSDARTFDLQWCIYPLLKGILPLRNPLPSVPPQIWFEAITTIISFLVLIQSCGSFQELRSPASLAPVRPTTAFLAGHVHSRHLQSRIANAPPGGLSGLTHYLEL